MEILLEILKWVKERSAPNVSHKYSRCPICNHAWWDDEELHNFDCWVPRLQKAAEQSVQRTASRAELDEQVQAMIVDSIWSDGK